MNCVLGDIFIMAKLLIIDDDEVSARFFGEILTSMGHRVAALGSAVDAAEVVGEITPDLILMDLEMPEVDGTEATRRLKQIPEFNSIPVVILTAHSEVQAFDEVQAAGADGFLNKQSDRPTIERTIESALAGRRSG
tara:strand:+ start:667 stop:1074 length:408 start_codon:yes stop_codon:yes gene_type:complete